MRRYLRILRHGPAARPFAAAVLARLPISMVPLGMVLLVQEVRGAYGIAGIVTAAFALATSVTTPLLGLLLDRLGQLRVIAPAALASAALLTAFALGAVGGASNAVLIALSAGVGAFFPPVGPAMRGAWRVVLTEEDDRRAAYALDAVAVETVFVGGPLILSALLVLAAPQVPLLVTAAFLALGGVSYALSPAARAWRAEPHDGDRVTSTSPLAARGVLPLLLVAVAMAVGFGQLDVSIAATAREVLGEEALVGLLFAAIAGGSASGGLVYGSRHWTGAERHRLPVAMGGFALGLTVLSLVVGVGVGAPRPTVLLVLLAVTGICIAPVLIIQQNLMDRLAPRHRLGEAQSWLNTAFTGGSAAGVAVAGLLVDAGGPGRAFLGAAAAVSCAALLGAVCQALWRGGDLPPAAVHR